MRKVPGGLLEAAARVGYGARGIVYLLVGTLAFMAACGARGGATGTSGAMRTVQGQPFGGVLLGLLAAGLFGFALWRALQAATDADHLGRDWMALLRRAGYALGALAHIGLGIAALSLLFGWGIASGDDDQPARDWTSWLLAQPFGRWLVFAIGIGIVCAGIGMAALACTRRFEARLALDGDAPRWAVPAGRAGFIARGAVFIVIGAFLANSALRFSSGEARGLAGALRALQAQPYGTALLGLVAVGLFGFGVVGLVQAVHRRIDCDVALPPAASRQLV